MLAENWGVPGAGQREANVSRETLMGQYQGGARSASAAAGLAAFQGVPVRVMDVLVRTQAQGTARMEIEIRDDWRDDRWWEDYHAALRDLGGE